ncbi:peptidoglycan bridge formation glycyltransferase FemA/FemB family protein [Terribacillus saccharophilus]|uniref:peptidoglycan bridge formation glycyltransferase FemA/FemB family protein n=1 Tax=Terribacillus saccharophilus TaxID=361277 RepID=UPI0039824A8C
MRKIEDIYFDGQYGTLYEKVEQGKAHVFNFKHEAGRIENQFIKRKIPIEGNDKYFDIVTPYGYGGPIIKNTVDGRKSELISAYECAFKEFCLENNIISEFIRFHPIVNNALDFKPVYDIELIRKTLGTNLSSYEDPIASEFSKKCRRNIRKALEKGITYEIEEGPVDIGGFMDIYYSTMNRNNAGDYYYFDEEYFVNTINLYRDHIVLVKAILDNKVIAQGFYFVFNDYIHTHLSGTLSEYITYSPAYILRYAITLWGKEKGFKLIHHGGGRTNSEDDTLYKFKRNFSKNTQFDFYIGKRVWNQVIYKDLCDITNTTKEAEFFPAYRSGLK